MSLVASILLLATFIVFVEFALGEGTDLIVKLGGLVAATAELGWPSGVQEEDRLPLLTYAMRAPAERDPGARGGREGASVTPAFEGGAAALGVSFVIEDNVAPIDVSPVTPGSTRLAEFGRV